MKKYIHIHPTDHVAVALSDLQIGETISINDQHIRLSESIAAGHKFATRPISEGDAIVKYGYPIGYATQDIASGEWVHTHNLKTALCSSVDYIYHPCFYNTQKKKIHPRFELSAFRRNNGDYGIRNDLIVVPMVGCVNAQAQRIVEKVRSHLDLSTIDDVRAYPHNYGCSQLGDDLKNTQKALGALVKHPNHGGVLVLALGCENNKLSDFKALLGDYDQSRIRFLTVQQVQDELEEGFRIMQELLHLMQSDQRVSMPLSALKVGLKCGASDGLSGITANPLVGAFSDWLISHGGTTVLTEVPEMFGAEQLLMNRAVNRLVFQDIVCLINDFKNYFIENHQTIYENPSPGNKDGGITTLEEKSLGAIQKSGFTSVKGVLNYTESIVTNGLNLLWSPGNDLVASSALAFSGCHLVLFTTGRGTPFGTFVPTIKIATNNELANYKKNWIDFNAGVLLDCEDSNVILTELVDKIIATCSGQYASNEKNGAKEIAIFKTGVTL